MPAQVATLRAFKRQQSQLGKLISCAKRNIEISTATWKEAYRAELAALRELQQAVATALDGNMQCFDCPGEDEVFGDGGYTSLRCGGQQFRWRRDEFLVLLEWEWDDKGRRRDNGVAGMVGFVARQLGKLEGQELDDALVLVSGSIV